MAGSRPELAGQLAGAYEERFVVHLTDLPRLLGLMAVPWAGWWFGLLEASVMLLVSGGTWALRYYGSSRFRDLSGQLVLLAAGLFSVLGTYRQLVWLDLVMHLLVLWVLTLLVHDALRAHGLLSGGLTGRLRWGEAIAVTSLGASLAVLWEIGEWIGHEFIDPGVGVGYRDTIGDLAAGMLGAAVAAWNIWRGSARSGTGQ
ncbi:hypothetical protein OK351_11415 [Glutamicibacter sp. MNS18]|uniref:hypothetical protein n=1 Tax=Glutamicibacter sp. MNS18 TaxID=2989817 RepID=UPI00223603C9|nr:hypothetical protein [Glutamicibacter sp. MNS18]MCW4466108.1 hypothetical protein [Glutamicibacter sp. MNS18]